MLTDGRGTRADEEGEKDMCVGQQEPPSLWSNPERGSEVSSAALGVGRWIGNGSYGPGFSPGEDGPYGLSIPALSAARRRWFSWNGPADRLEDL